MECQYQKGCFNMRTWLAVACILLLGGNAGCERGLALIPVRGSVKLDGKPVANCAVAFQPVAGGPVASGTTDDGGCFALTTVNRPGAVPGEHRVLLTKQRYIKEDNCPRYEFLTPKRYAMPETSGLKANVSDNEHDFVFEMSSK